MGCDHYFYLILASKYIKHLRPKYRSIYGPMSVQITIWEQKQKLGQASIINDILSSDFIERLLSKRPQEKGPLQQYFQSRRTKCDYSDELYEKISANLAKYAENIYQTRSHFLRMERSLRQMDLFQDQGHRIKVSNKLQVQNFIHYMETTKKALKIYNGKWKHQYSGVDQAHQIFSKVLAKMDQNKKQTYLIFESSN